MIHYVVMDYDGEPAVIKNGHMLIPEPPRATNERGCEIRYQVWNPDIIDWEDPDIDEYPPLVKSDFDYWAFN